MVRLQVQEGKVKFDLDCDDTTTVMTIKEAVFERSKLPIEFQKAILKGKTREDGDKINDLGLADGAKVLIMRKAGAPAPSKEDRPVQSGEKPAEDPASKEKEPIHTLTTLVIVEAEDRDMENNQGEQLTMTNETEPGEERKSKTENDSSSTVKEKKESGLECLFAIKVKQGKNSHTIRCTQRNISFAQVGGHLSKYCIPGVPREHFRYVAKGKQITDDENTYIDKVLLGKKAAGTKSTEGAEGSAEAPGSVVGRAETGEGAADGAAKTTQNMGNVEIVQVLLLFKEGHYQSLASLEWISEHEKEVKKISESLGRLEKRISHRLIDDETLLRMNQSIDIVESVCQSVKIIRVNKDDLERKRKLEEAAEGLRDKLAELRKMTIKQKD